MPGLTERKPAQKVRAKLVDCHIHSCFSVDSDAGVDTICQSALQKGLAGICITDHLEFCTADEGYGFYKTNAYFHAIESAKEKYDGKLKVLSGIEMGDPHRFPKEYEPYYRLPYDMVIGSVHFWYNDMRVEDMPAAVPFEAAIEAYFLAVEKCAAHGGFDVMGHLGFPKKYYGREIEPDETHALGQILNHLSANGIVPEINTSSLCRGMAEPTPNHQTLQLYHALGGRRLILGSDAHHAANVGFAFSDMLTKYERQFEFGYFENRKFRPLDY